MIKEEKESPSLPWKPPPSELSPTSGGEDLNTHYINVEPLRDDDNPSSNYKSEGADGEKHSADTEFSKILPAVPEQLEGNVKEPESEAKPKKRNKSTPKSVKNPKGVKIEGMPGEPTLYQCDFCHKVYPSVSGIKYHRMIFHSTEYTPPVCNICGKTFRLQKYLDNHKNTVHLKLKDHLCDMCGKAFSSKFGLKLHKMIHRGEKNFPCEICGMRFNTVGRVNTHKVVHGGPKLYVCEVCSRSFRWKKSLLTHMRTHSGERPYKCEHCGRSFSVLWNLQQHVRIHTGERPYACDLCGKTFTFNSSMKEHRAKHNATIP